MRLRHCLPVHVVATVLAACTSHRDDAAEKNATTASAVTWAEQQDLVPSEPVTQLFGRRLVATPTFVAVGDSSAQAVYIFERQAHDWTQTAKLVPPADGKQTMEFAWSLAGAGQNVFIRRKTVEDLTSGHSPRVLVYERSSSGWQLKEQLSGDDVAREDFGIALATDGNTLVVGAVDDQTSFQAIPACAYVFERIAGSFTRTQRLEPLRTSAGCIITAKR